MTKYIINIDASQNPNNDMEIHTVEHADSLRIPERNRRDLGWFDDPYRALIHAELLLPTGARVDGCAVCCPSIHRR